MAISLRYTPFVRDDGTPTRGPFIPLRIRNSRGAYTRIIALVDSGADSIVIPKNLSLALGLHESDQETESIGIGGNTPVRQSKVTLSISGPHEQ